MGFLPGFSFREKITVGANPFISIDLNNFPVAVRMDSSKTHFWANVKADGGDVRFTSVDGTTLLNFETESFDNVLDDANYHGTSPILSSSAGTPIYIYYGNASATDGSNKVATWAGHNAVWLMDENKAAGAFDDSTGIHPLTNNGTIDRDGAVGRGRGLDGGDDSMFTAAHADWNLGAGDFFYDVVTEWDDITRTDVVAGLSADEGASDRAWVLSTKKTGGDGIYKIFIQYSTNGSNFFDLLPATTVTIVQGQKHYMAWSREGNTARFFFDAGTAGTADATGATFRDPGNNQLYIGAFAGFAAPFDGMLDNSSFVKGDARSADWAAARNQSWRRDWLTFGGVETVSTPIAEPPIILERDTERRLLISGR